MPNYEAARAINQKIIDTGFRWEEAGIGKLNPALEGTVASHLAYSLSGAEVDYVEVIRNKDAENLIKKQNATDEESEVLREMLREYAEITVLAFAGGRIATVTVELAKGTIESNFIFGARELSVHIIEVPNLLSTAPDKPKIIQIGVHLKPGFNYILTANDKTSSEKYSKLEYFLPKLLTKYKRTKH